MTTFELHEQVKRLQMVLLSVEDDLRLLRDGPIYDKNYKIERWGKQLTRENFDLAHNAAQALSLAIDLLIRSKT